MVLNILVILIYKYIWNPKISTEGRPYSANMWLFCSHIKEFDFKAHFWYSSAFRLIIFNWICFHRKDMAYWFWDTTPSKSDTKTQCDAILRGAAHQRRKAQQISGMGTAATFLFGLRSCFLVSEITVEGRWKEVKKNCITYLALRCNKYRNKMAKTEEKGSLWSRSEKVIFPPSG